MKIGILGNMIKFRDVNDGITLFSLESAERAIENKEVNILMIYGTYPSCDNCRDIVITSRKELKENFLKINPEVKVIFLERKE